MVNKRVFLIDFNKEQFSTDRHQETATIPQLYCTILDLLAPTEPPIDICDTSLCDFGKCVNVNGTATCVCNKACPFIEQPVCGSDNKTYPNLCAMDSDACERKERVTVKHDGPCGELI